MLASIHPLGERAKHNRWAVTVASYLLGSVTAGALLGAALGTLGLHAGRAAVAALCVIAALVDASRRRVPSWRRQVNEDWLRRYRGWVYGIGFGFQLGLGVVTIVTSAAVYLTFTLAALSGSTAAGAVIGALFGLSRAAPLLLMGGVAGPEHLRALHARFAGAAPWARRVTVAGLFSAALGSFR